MACLSRELRSNFAGRWASRSRDLSESSRRKSNLGSATVGSIVVGKISENDAYAYGYDAQEGEYGDLVSKGIIDPTKVVRTALQDAASIAGLLMTTEAMVAQKPKKETPMPATRRPEEAWTTNSGLKGPRPGRSSGPFASRCATGPRVMRS